MVRECSVGFYLFEVELFWVMTKGQVLGLE